MAKEKLITITQLKGALKDFSKKELVDLVAEISKSCPQAKEFLTLRFLGNAEELVHKYKKKIEHEFYPSRGHGRLNLREAKKAISDFKKLTSDKALHIDLLLFYVENCVEFTNDYGDIGESFYNSAESVFGQAVKALNSAGKDVYEQFEQRINNIVDNATDGWGFSDALAHIRDEIDWFTDDEEYD